MRSRWLLACGASCAALISGAATAQVAAAPAAAGSAAPSAGGSAPNTVQEIVVTARRLDEARNAIQPQIGASVYGISDQAIKEMPGGQDVQLDQVLLQAPGVTEDSYGQVHVRGEHNGLQFRINGVILPEGLSVFGQALNPRIIDRISLITGALPAEYGLRTGGIVDITTKTGLDNGGSVTMYGGSHDTLEPSAEIHGHSGTWTYFFTLSYLQNGLGIEAPDTSSTPIHDKTNQYQGFGYVEDILSENSRIALMLGTSDERFQIPDLYGNQPQLGLSVAEPAGVQTQYPSQNLNENQRENTQFAALSYLYDAGPFTGQVSLFGRYSTLTFVPDPLGDLLYDGISQFANKSDTAGGLQAEGVYRLTPAHTLRAGVIVEVDRSISDTASQVLPDTSNVPETIVDDGAKTATTASVYLQDEWHILSNLILNYGLRFDQFDGYRDENQLSPRVNLVWNATSSTTLHAGYARYFSPPPFELVGSETVSKFTPTSAAPPSTQDTTPYSERANYFDVGVSQSFFSRGLVLGVDTYYKRDKDLVDEGQFGAPIILTPFNYAVGRQYGVEFTASYTHGPLQAYANFATQRAQGEDIISSQFNFDAADLAYIQNHFINLDHSASYTASAGASYALPVWSGTRLGADATYGSGLRADLDLPSGAVIPNGLTLPNYIQVNLTASHRFANAPGGALTVRLDVINVADRTIELRNGTGVGVFAPQYGPRRGFFAGVTKEF